MYYTPPPPPAPILNCLPEAFQLKSHINMQSENSDDTGYMAATEAN